MSVVAVVEVVDNSVGELRTEQICGNVGRSEVSLSQHAVISSLSLIGHVAGIGSRYLQPYIKNMFE